jgi:hypothetical protein
MTSGSPSKARLARLHDVMSGYVAPGLTGISLLSFGV